MSELKNGYRMAREAFKYNNEWPSATPNLYRHNSGLVLSISLELLNSYSNVAAGLSKNCLNVQWYGGENQTGIEQIQILFSCDAFYVQFVNKMEALQCILVVLVGLLYFARLSLASYK
jgi:hypothetical protein